MHAEATLAGFKAAAVATVASAVPTVSIVYLFEHSWYHKAVRISSHFEIHDLCCSAGEREDAAVGESQHQPHRPGSHHLHRYIFL
jgi:ribosomal protein S17